MNSKLFKTAKHNLLDALVLTSLMLLAIMAFLIMTQPSRSLGQDALLTVRIEKPSEYLVQELEKRGAVYLNGVEEPVSIVSAQRVGNAVEVVVSGKGTKDSARLTFNGQRVLINQKAELYGTFLAKGKIIRLEVR